MWNGIGWYGVIGVITTSTTDISLGLVVRLRTPDRGIPGSNPTQTVGFCLAENSSHVCSSSPRCINGYTARAGCLFKGAIPKAIYIGVRCLKRGEK